MSKEQGPKGSKRRPGAMTMAMQAVAIKPSGPKVLRIGIFKDQRIVEERVIRNRETVSIGNSEKNHFIVKSELLPNRFELFQLVGSNYILNFTRDMTGRVVLPGGIQQLETLRDTGGARNAGTHYQIRLADSSRGNIKIGPITLFFEFVAPPPVTPKPQLPAAVQGGLFQSIDWSFTASVVLSYMFFFGMIVYLEHADWEVQQQSDAIPDVIARFILEEPLPEEPEQEFEEEEGPAEEEEPAKAAKDRPEKAGPEVEQEVVEADISAETRARIAEEAAAQAETMLLGALGDDGGLADVLREGAVTGNAADVLAQASGVGVATGGSKGKLRTRAGGKRGSGQSGLGALKASEGAGKSAKEGKAIKERRIRGDVGLKGGGDIGGRGEFDAALVVQQIKRRITAIKRCYESELRKNPTLKGKVTIEFTIEERGTVSGVKAVENSTGSEAVATCVQKTVRRFRFNPGPEGGSVTFRYPFIFNPQQ